MTEIHHQLYINASCAKVFVAISSQRGLSKWWGDTNDIRTDFGALLPFIIEDGTIQTLKIIDAKLAQSLAWKCVEGSSDWLDTDILFQLNKEGLGTTVHFRHTGWKRNNEQYACANYLWSRRLSYLKELCETGETSSGYLEEIQQRNKTNI